MSQGITDNQAEGAIEAHKEELTFKKAWSSPKLRRLVTELTEGKIPFPNESTPLAAPS
jgi:hypothetical protein